ncbi:hypothetical protein FMO003_15590 [Moritella sp. F3]|nr:hypothetical protein FMO001_37640 [Moritella sp. F1]GIC81278.1 hypothetical protein FMO003_15590 [Moritella sp. F3]
MINIRVIKIATDDAPVFTLDNQFPVIIPHGYIIGGNREYNEA